MTLRQRSYMSEEHEPLAPKPGHILDGASKQKAVKYLYKLIGKTADGFFSDQYWRPVNEIFKKFRKDGISWVIDKAEYGHEGGVPVRKKWHVRIGFKTPRGKQQVIYGTITADGAGPVKDPLEKYDVTVVLG